MNSRGTHENFNGGKGHILNFLLGISLSLVKDKKKRDNIKKAHKLEGLITGNT